jgi:hypothetical protein
MSAGTPVPAVVPWEDMTPRQQAEHLVHGHGWDAPYFFEPGEGDDAAVVTIMATRWTAEDRLSWHREDHAEDHGWGRDGMGGGRPHLHDKGPGRRPVLHMDTTRGEQP